LLSRQKVLFQLAPLTINLWALASSKAANGPTLKTLFRKTFFPCHFRFEKARAWVMGVSLKTENEERSNMTLQERGSEGGPTMSVGGRRALSHISMWVLRGHSPEALRPPHTLPEAEHRAAGSSFSVLRETSMTEAIGNQFQKLKCYLFPGFEGDPFAAVPEVIF
jgi:hypothetical protein